MIRKDEFFAKFEIVENASECRTKMKDARVTGRLGRNAFENQKDAQQRPDAHQSTP